MARISKKKSAKSAAARRGWETRRLRAAEAEKAAKKRSEAARKGAATRKRNAEKHGAGRAGPGVAPKRKAVEVDGSDRAGSRSERAKLADFFRGRGGEWANYTNGNGEGSLTRLLEPGESPLRVLAETEALVIDVVHSVANTWFQVGVMFRNEFLSPYKAGKSRQERYRKHHGHWSKFTQPVRQKHAGMATWFAEGVVKSAIEAGYAIRGFVVRAYYGGKESPKGWRQKQD